jgi:hypothetical protein
LKSLTITPFSTITEVNPNTLLLCLPASLMLHSPSHLPSSLFPPSPPLFFLLKF